MLNLTLRQLRYFDALARHRHFGRAAEACAISQPALSEQIKELEATFGALLFERGARPVRMSSFGEALGERVRRILGAIDELDGLVGAQHPLRRLRLGVIPTVAPYLLPSVLRDLTREGCIHFRYFRCFARHAVTEVHRDLIIQRATSHLLPTIFAFAPHASAGALVTYGIDRSDALLRTTEYVDRILRGTKPADLPVQGPKTFELVVNLKTAKVLGLAISPTLLARADKVIE